MMESQLNNPDDSPKALEKVSPIPAKAQKTKKDYSVEKMIDRNISKLINVYQTTQRQKYEEEKDNRSIDKYILILFAFALLISLFFTFYMISKDKLEAVTQILYPIITAIIGFMSGYFAGTGRRKRGR